MESLTSKFNQLLTQCSRTSDRDERNSLRNKLAEIAQRMKVSREDIYQYC